MLKEALEWFRQLSVDGQDRYRFEDGNGEDIIFDRRGGTITRIQRPVVVNATIGSIEDLIAFESNCGGSAYFIDDCKVSLIDVLAPRNRATLKLAKNPIFDVFAKCQSMTHEQCMKTLRLGFAAVRIEPETFKGVIGKLKFSTGSDTESTIGKGDESLSRKVRASVTGESELPQVISVAFNVYPSIDVDTTVVVDCSVIVDPTNQTISIVPLPGEIDSAFLEAQKAIQEHIKENSELSVYLGTFTG